MSFAAIDVKPGLERPANLKPGRDRESMILRLRAITRSRALLLPKGEGPGGGTEEGADGLASATGNDHDIGMDRTTATPGNQE
jgi:hypothetical protein